MPSSAPSASIKKRSSSHSHPLPHTHHPSPLQLTTSQLISFKLKCISPYTFRWKSLPHQTLVLKSWTWLFSYFKLFAPHTLTDGFAPLPHPADTGVSRRTADGYKSGKHTDHTSDRSQERGDAGPGGGLRCNGRRIRGGEHHKVTTIAPPLPSASPLSSHRLIHIGYFHSKIYGCLTLH